jgi:hypothetical protein
MDKLTIISNKETYIQHLSILSYPPELQRIYYYRNLTPRFVYENRKETDTHIYWSTVDRKPRFENEKFFYTRQATSGITYDKKKKTAKIWFGQHYNQLPISLRDDCLIMLAPWVLNKISHSVQSLINNTIFSKIVGGKIKNSTELVEAYLKTSPYKNMDVDIKLFHKVFNQRDAYHSVKSFKDILLSASNINDAIKYLDQYVCKAYIHNDPIFNLATVARMLDIKIDVNMSHKKATELHDELKIQVAKNIEIYKNIEDVN